MVFVFQDSCVGADAYVEVAILGGLAEEFNVAAVQQVVATRHKDFFICHNVYNQRGFISLIEKFFPLIAI